MVEKARDLMKIGVKTVERDRSVYEAIRILVERHISGLPVTDGPRIVGIITEKDVLQLVVHREHLPGPVETYMTREVVTFEEDTRVAEIWNCLVTNAYRRVPIVRQGKLTGIISRTDLLRDRIGKFGPQPSRRATHGREGPCVRDVMTAGLQTTTPHTPVAEAAQVLVANEITALPVVDDAMSLVGMLTEKDVLSLLDDGPVPVLRVGEIMTSDVTSFTVNDSVFDVCECLARNSFRSVPILDRGRLAGIASRADLILYILKNQSLLAQTAAPVGAGAPR